MTKNLLKRHRKGNPVSGIRVIFLIPLLAFMCRSLPTYVRPVKSEILWAGEWSPDGQVIAVGGNYDSLLLFDWRADRQHSYSIPHTITKLSWHPDGEKLAIGTQGENTGLYLLDVAKGKLQNLSPQFPDGCRALGWNSDGSKLAVGQNDGTLYICTNDGQIMSRIESTQKAITGLSWHPTKDMIVTVGHHIELHSLSDGNSLSVRPRDEEVLMLSVEWHPSGEFFVTGDYGDHQIGHSPALQFWDPAGSEIRLSYRSKAEFRNVTWKSDGEILATASDGLRLWSKDGELLTSVPTPALLWGLSWSPDDEYLVTTSLTGHILIYNEKGVLQHQLTR